MSVDTDGFSSQSSVAEATNSTTAVWGSAGESATTDMVWGKIVPLIFGTGADLSVKVVGPIMAG